MQIENNRVVSFEYTLRNKNGDVLDQSEAGNPLSYIHGHGQLIPGVEKNLLGKGAGDALRFVVPPAEGYGEYDPEAQQQVDKSAFPPGMPVEAGQQFLATDQSGAQRPVRISNVEGDTVTIDLNHPLAGEDLDFDVKVTDVREATQEELEHGHVHGPEGHDH